MPSTAHAENTENAIQEMENVYAMRVSQCELFEIYLQEKKMMGGSVPPQVGMVRSVLSHVHLATSGRIVLLVSVRMELDVMHSLENVYVPMVSR